LVAPKFQAISIGLFIASTYGFEAIEASEVSPGQLNFAVRRRSAVVMSARNSFTKAVGLYAILFELHN